MGFLDDVSSGLGEWSRTSLNAQFGGGCPICKGDDTMDRRSEDGKILLVCEKCGAAFDNVFFKGLKMVSGDRRYLDQTLPTSIWRIVRLLPAEDCLLASYSDGAVKFFATEAGVIRVKNSATLLNYSDIKAVSLATVWMLSVYLLVGVLLFFTVGIASALLGLSLASPFGFVYALVFFCMGGLLLFFGRRKVYQFDSSVLSSKELRGWRICKLKSKDAQGFVSLVSAHLSPRRS
jgi:hypothetical protein